MTDARFLPSTGTNRSPIRNLCLARGEVRLDTSAPVYTVPAGFVVLLKSIFISDWSTQPQPMAVNLRDGTAATFIRLKDETLQPYTTLEWSGWVALNEGDGVYVAGATLPNVFYWVSGALLPFAPTLIPPIIP